MRRADAASAVAVEILVEQHMVAEIRIVLQPAIGPEDGTLAPLVAEKNPAETM